jgi:four helix bundle protein
MGEIKTFKDLIAWQKSMLLAQDVYSASALMPDTERFGLTSQMRRSAVPIPSNIAEGYARQSTDEYLRFLRIARGSLAELTTQLELATRLKFIQPSPVLTSLLSETDRVLQGLIRSLER